VSGGRWSVDRPISFVEDAVLRDALASALPQHRFWFPPCETGDLPRLVGAIGVTRSAPDLAVSADRQRAAERGESLRIRFENAVDHLSNELARNDPVTREKLQIGWDQLKGLPLFVYEGAFPVRAYDPALSPSAMSISLKALMGDLGELHVSEDALGDREHGGRAIATLFPSPVRRKIDGEWALAWQKSLEKVSEAIRLASDEEIAEALQRQADKINSGPKARIKVSPPASRSPEARPRTLKESVGAVAGATVNAGNPPKPLAPIVSPSLKQKPPEPSAENGSGNPVAPVAYTNADLEQRGWEILVQALETSPDDRLVDFRKRHGVGADGAIDWKTFVEMKATGRSPQGSIEMSNAEFERAQRSGKDFILALVSGLETGHKDEVRLIFDPANRVQVRPINGVRLLGLSEAPSVIIHFEGTENPAGGE
jgi:hypothetical protein